eukprot:CAMPEP_0182559674 /NCGR_PEP_ID=MMETSP1324-20130603/2704_1 /TAXON_ID=236786 /ORGANISM="Florenciella sp., Strain RCC1587" /LENGTH=232 /DNA_ID=CAMNT_0024771955 /DNA_START=150 /DNA_END=848 /DNA_ORIENTATION=+
MMTIDLKRREEVAQQRQAAHVLGHQSLYHPENTTLQLDTLGGTPQFRVQWRYTGKAEESEDRRDTRLIKAVERGQLNEVNNLLQLGNFGVVPASHKTAATELLCCQDWKGQTALHWAACNGMLRIAKVLIECDAPLEVRDQQGLCALHVACQYGHLPIVKALVRKGAAIESTDISGRMPLFYAEQRKYRAVVAFIKDEAPAILAEIRQKEEEERKWREDHGLEEEGFDPDDL